MTTSPRELRYLAHPPGPRRYDINGGLPWHYETETRPTRAEAWAEAVAWAEAFRERDTLGNSAHPLGVVSDPRGGWRGVVNYYHSNT